MEASSFILFHASALLGHLGSAVLVPETRSAIVILGNTLGAPGRAQLDKRSASRDVA